MRFLSTPAGDGDFYDSLNQIKNVLRKDLWVVGTASSTAACVRLVSPGHGYRSLIRLFGSLGYRDTVSADLQQLASHVIWANDLWPKIKTPSLSGATAAANESEEEEEEEGEVSEEEHALRRQPKKRGRDRQVRVTSQQSAPASNDSRNRRDSNRAWQQRGGAQLPGVNSGAPPPHQGGSYHQSAGGGGGADSVSPRQRHGMQQGAVPADGAHLNTGGFQQHSHGGDLGGGAPPSPGRSRGGYQLHPGEVLGGGVPPHTLDGAPPPPLPPGRPRGGGYRQPTGDLGGGMPPNPAVSARYNDNEEDDRSAPRGGRRHQRGKRQRNGECGVACSTELVSSI